MPATVAAPRTASAPSRASVQPRASVPPRTPVRPEGRVTHAPYRREPYIRARPVPGVTVDGKAVAWTRTHVLLHWIDDDGQAHNRWLAAALVHRIQRSDSGWQDPYDDHAFYLGAAQAAPAQATAVQEAAVQAA
ncbi:hypothetical protein BN1051_02728 [Arthrobacter saudimassiliensis]|uniref:Uncharacterized protein n=1 Tax=Arthrobacter saudimassiliensis TaxID=1461584 RepID=A0A078MSV9_9MICC|nr:hypothetical protein BN1051_02728 [Arthrobacter saudimassiliensis]